MRITRYKYTLWVSLICAALAVPAQAQNTFGQQQPQGGFGQQQPQGGFGQQQPQGGFSQQQPQSGFGQQQPQGGFGQQQPQGGFGQQQPQSGFGQQQPQGSLNPQMDQMLDQLAQYERQDFGVQATPQLHSGAMHGPTPASLPGGQIITTKGLVELIQSQQTPYILFDVLGGPMMLPGATPAVQAAQPGQFGDQVSQQMGQYLAGC